MTLWLIFALMTAAAIFAVLWPLARKKVGAGGSDLAVYRDQLDEVGRDRATGLIGESEAEAARIEISRRLIAAADVAEAEKAKSAKAPGSSPLWRRRAAALVALVLLPAGAVMLYLAIGSPDLPGEPLAERQRAEKSNPTIESLIARVEDHVRRNPTDGRAWDVLAPVYMRVGRFDEAAAAWQNSIRLNGSTAQREADLGEALVASSNGIVTDGAKAAFDRTLKLDKQNVMARFYTGMAADQDGRRAEAEAIWRNLLAKAPPGAPWVEVVRHALERKAPPQTASTAAPGDAPGPSAADMAAAAKLAPAEQNKMIRGMVDRLAARLKQDGSDVGGWVRLVRSYRVLGENDKAQAALADARAALASEPDKLKQLTAKIEAANPAPGAAAGTAAPSAADVAAMSKLLPEQQNKSVDEMVAGLATRLKKNGSDVDGWTMLVRSYRVLGQKDKADAALADARAALANEPDKLKWLNAQMAAPSPAAPMTPAQTNAPGPSAADMTAVAQMSPDQQKQMIRGMVARLADKLKQDGSDVNGWQRLLRAYIVLGERDKAVAAASDARKALAGDAAKLKHLEDAIKSLGLGA